ncbi:PHA/PHB synthase family protein [Sphingorhabdus sp.]|jgi:polyhydroxyalkanoate synthase|uniref:PHA/PHB synthase family protein n=2 Tax=Sphingorhabdus sp. TaxID=1902408 RepID=UPI003C7705F7|nr:alpha/beta fold hydrolase [Sphingomonadales bacterium]
MDKDTGATFPFDPEMINRWVEDLPAVADPVSAYKQVMDMWGGVLAPLAKAGHDNVNPRDKRFAGPEWEQPVFDLMRQGYKIMSDYMIGAAEQLEGVPEAERAKIAFAVRTVVDAMSPSNSPFTNPVALQRAVETKGESLMKGMSHLWADMQRGQLTHTDSSAFELGRNIACTPGKVVYQSRLFQLLQFEPTTEKVLETPLVIFPPWINRYYILDLTAERSYIRWCVEQGISVFVVSWKSADESMGDVVWDDYIAAQIEAIDTIRDLLDVNSVHAIGYCVAGTTLAATLSILAARGEADKVKAATFFTAQVDFTSAGDLLNFVDDGQISMIEALSSKGYLDGRVMALTFNMLRGNDLIWSTVGKHYLLGEDYPSFDLLHWNGDVTNLPARWHREYLTELYRDNRLVVPGSISALGVPIDLTRVATPSYIQAGREDHIAPAESVWKIRDHFKGPLTFVLAGSGHIAGVVNPPALGKYQYWTNDAKVETLDQFIEGATETKGSWWPHWRQWLEEQDAKMVPAKGARKPGKGKLKALEDAPGTFVKTR